MARIEAKDVIHYIKRDTDVEFRALICLTEAGTSTTKSTNSTDTRCGILKSTGSSDTSFTGTGVIEDDPETTEISYMELREMAEADEEFDIVSKNESETVYIAGRGKITDISDTNSQGQHATYSYTIAIEGAISLAPGS